MRSSQFKLQLVETYLNYFQPHYGEVQGISLYKVIHSESIGPWKHLLIARKSSYFQKKLSLCHKSQISNTYISKTRWRKPFIFQTLIIWSFRIHSLKYLRSTTLGCRDKGIKKTEFVTMTLFLLSFFEMKMI